MAKFDGMKKLAEESGPGLYNNNNNETQVTALDLKPFYKLFEGMVGSPAQLALFLLAAAADATDVPEINTTDVPEINAVDSAWQDLDMYDRLAATRGMPRYEPGPKPYFPSSEFTWPRTGSLIEMTKGVTSNILVLKEFPHYKIRKFSGKPGLLIRQSSLAVKVDDVSGRLVCSSFPLTLLQFQPFGAVIYMAPVKVGEAMIDLTLEYWPSPEGLAAGKTGD
jgi:hypothetical protein